MKEGKPTRKAAKKAKTCTDVSPSGASLFASVTLLIVGIIALIALVFGNNLETTLYILGAIWLYAKLS